MNKRNNKRQEFIELRVAHKGHPYVALLGRRDKRFGFQRIFDLYYDRREFLSDGRQEQVHHLPLADFVYEVEEVKEGRRTRRYIATCTAGTVHDLSLSEVEAIADGRLTVSEAISKHKMGRAVNANDMEEDDA